MGCAMTMAQLMTRAMKKKSGQSQEGKRRVGVLNSRQYKEKGKYEQNTGHNVSIKCGSCDCSCLILINQGMHFANKRSHKV